jgi:arginase
MVNLLGIGYDMNSSFLRGAALAPDRIRQMQSDGSANEWCERGHSVAFAENILDKGNIHFEKTDSESAFNAIQNRIALEIVNGDRLICLGGDHSISFPIIAAFSKKYGPIHVLHIDAHGDLYENFDGNKYSHASPFARLMENGCMASLTQVGIRSLNAHQRMQIQKYNIHCIEMKDYDSDFVQNLQGPLYISLDLDGLDPAYAPGVSHHEPGGFTCRQVIDMIHHIPVPIIGADIVEYNPARDLHNLTAMVAYKLMKEIASKMMHPQE